MALDFKLKALLKLNFKFFLDMHLLREGAFINISSGIQFYDGSDMSVLLPDTSAADTLGGISDGQVWQSPFREWVYESGVPLDGTRVVDSPIVASGLYIEGAFRAPDDAVFGHTRDFINGRVIFNAPQSLDLKVNAEFSAREVRTAYEHQFNQQYETSVLENKYKTNPLTSNQLVYPSGLLYPFPAVFLEVTDRSFSAFEIGNRSLIIKDTLRLHVWALDDMERDNIVDILTSQMRKSVPMIDFNRAPLPLSGIFNTLSPEYVPYQNMLKNNVLITTVGSGSPVRYTAYIDDVTAENVVPDEEYERAVVDFNISVYLNAPTTPLGHLFGPISNIPTIGDTGF
jgi:hypothetical protein